MGLESLGFSAPWLWFGSSSQNAASSSRKHRKSSGKSSGKASKAVRTRAEQVALNDLGNVKDSRE